MNGQESFTQATSSWDLLQESLKPFRAGDLEGTLAYWADDAVVELIGGLPGQPDGYAGKEQLRGWFESLVPIHFEIEEELIKVEGDTLTVRARTFSDPTRQLGVTPLEATEVYVIKNGKIASFTWTISPESEAKLQAALAKLTPP